MISTISGRPRFRELQTRPVNTAGPYAEPMHIAEAKLQVRQSGSDEDATYARLIGAARRKVEWDTNRRLIWQRVTVTLDQWPDRIEIRCCPVRTIDSIAYKDTAGDTQTLATTVYKTRLDLEPAIVSLKSGQVWPPTYDESGAITITLTVGYAVPFTVSSNTLTFVGFAPTNGDSYRLSNSGGILPGGLNATTDYYVVSSSGSTCSLSLTAGGAAITLSNAGSGIHYLGVVDDSAMQAMRMLIAGNYEDREGSSALTSCENAYRTTLEPLLYTRC